MKATCPSCDTDLNYEENIKPVRCYNCGTEIPKEDVVEEKVEEVYEADPEEIPATKN